MRLKEAAALAATVVAVAVPMLVVHWVPLGHGIAAQMLAVGLWGVALVLWSTLAAPIPWQALAPLLSALGLVALGIVVSVAWRGTPPGLWIGSLGVVAAAAAVAVAAAAAARSRPDESTRALMWGVALAAAASLVVAGVQLAAPGRADVLWVAPAQTPGRASANLGQPNHLALLLLWGWLVTAVWPGRSTASDPRAGVLPAPSAGIGAFLITFGMQAGLVATSSRAGLIASLVLATWAALDPRLPRTSAWLLWSTALGGLAVTLGRVMMYPASALGTGASLVRPGARSGVFMDSLALLREHPLLGVGWHEFQTAWALSPLGDRGPRYYEHAHNLALNLAVELGLPLALAVCACLVWGAWQLLRTVRRVSPSLQPRARMLLAMLAAAGVLSGFDAPFWEAGLLLPAAWAWGCAVGLIAGRAIERTGAVDGTGAPPSTLTPAPRSPYRLVAASPLTRIAIAALAGILTLGAGWAWTDFRRMLPADALAPSKIAAGGTTLSDGHSRLFGHFADREAALSQPSAGLEVFRGARWVAIDTRLLVAWVAALERAGRIDEARYLTQRALEFRDPAFGPWLAECRVVAPLQPPVRCQAPTRELNWTQFR
jgi:O-antigen ligase